MRHAYAESSRRCHDVLPNTSLLACSTSVGWTSLLARHSRSTGLCDVYDTLPTADHSIVVVTRGTVDVETLQCGRWRAGTYRAGSAGMTAPGASDRLKWRLRSESNEFEKLHVFLPRALIDEAAEHLRRPGQATPTASLNALVFRDRPLANIASALISAMQHGAPDIYAQATAQWIAIHLLSTFPDASGGSASPPGGLISDARLARALEYMTGNLSGPLDLEMIASEAGVSKFHFVRLFRESTGETPMQCLINLRLDKAARLLLTSDLQIGRIAYDCGYPNVTHFSGAFRQRYARSPSDYRRGTPTPAR